MDIRESVEKLLADYLFCIEWKYGECRAPFRWPPRVYETPENYICEIQPEDSDESLKISGRTPEELLANIKVRISGLFGDHFPPPARGDAEPE